MNKLGFAITRASQGAGSVLTCNAGDWTTHLTDIRAYIKLFGATLGEDRAIPFLTFVEDGCFLGVIRQITSSVDDYFGGWIYIPRNIAISGEELEQHMAFAKSVLTEDSIHLKDDEINAQFSTTYPERYSSPYIASTGERYGVRNPGVMSTLTEILDHRYQESYKGFRAIFLTDPVYVANEYKSKFGNFTNRKLEKSFIVIPPTDVSRFGDGTKLLVYNGEKYVHFASPVRTKEGTPLRMSLKRPPFDSYRFTYNATKDNDVIDLQPLKFEWQIRVSRSRFQVYGDDHKPIVDAIIRIGDEVISGDLLVKESAAKNAEVHVSAAGYKECKLVLDLFNLEDNIEINLMRNNANYTREIALPGGKTGTVTIEAPGISLTECPLEGYTEGSNGVLTVDRYAKLKERAIGFGGALGLGAILFLGIWGISALLGGDEPKQGEEVAVVDKDSLQNAEVEPEVEGEDEEEEEVDEYELSEEAAEAIAAAVWKKETLESYEELEGLFEALNHYQLDELTGEGKWAEAIREAHPDFADFLENGFPERKWTNPTYLPEKGDRSITIANFKKNVLAAAERKKNGGAKPAAAPAKPAAKPAPAKPAAAPAKPAAKPAPAKPAAAPAKPAAAPAKPAAAPAKPAAKPAAAPAKPAAAPAKKVGTKPADTKSEPAAKK